MCKTKITQAPNTSTDRCDCTSQDEKKFPNRRIQLSLIMKLEREIVFIIISTQAMIDKNGEISPDGSVLHSGLNLIMEESK